MRFFSGPYVEIDMRSGEMDGYDAIFLSPHKFLGGPGTPGILLMSKALYQLSSSAPSTCGGGTVAYVNGFSEKVQFTPSKNQKSKKKKNSHVDKVIHALSSCKRSTLNDNLK